MTEQTNAEMIAEARGIDNDWVLDNSPDDSVEVIRELSDALEAADQRAAQAEAELEDVWRTDIPSLKDQRDAATERAAEYAAVVEKVRTFIERQSGWFRYRAEPLSTVLASAPEGVLRELRADVWDEGWSAAGAWQIAEPGTSYPWNPYRKEQDRG